MECQREMIHMLAGQVVFNKWEKEGSNLGSPHKGDQKNATKLQRSWRCWLHIRFSNNEHMKRLQEKS